MYNKSIWNNEKRSLEHEIVTRDIDEKDDRRISDKWPQIWPQWTVCWTWSAWFRSNCQIGWKISGAFADVLRPRRHMFLLVLQLRDPLMATRSQPTNGDLSALFGNYAPCVRSHCTEGRSAWGYTYSDQISKLSVCATICIAGGLPEKWGF